MPSLRYHSGRMVLIPQAEGWMLRLRTKQGVLELPLRGTELETALMEAEQLYAEAAACEPQDAMERLDVELAREEIG